MRALTTGFDVARGRLGRDTTTEGADTLTEIATDGPAIEIQSQQE
jgi:hypothetical protein